MRIGILGSGLIGGKLGTVFARAGHRVVFSYSRSERKLMRLAKAAGDRALAGTPAEAVNASDVLLLAVHWSRVNDVLKQAGSLRGKTVISCCLPMSLKDHELVVAHTSSGAEVLARKVMPARFVAAFGTIPSEVLFDVFAARTRKDRPTLIYYGDNRAAKKVAERLIRDIGFDPIDAGPLTIGRYAEPFTLLVARLAYDIGRRPEMAYRFEWFGKRRAPRRKT